MKKILTYTIYSAILLFVVISCSTEDIRNIAGNNDETDPNPPLSTEVIPIDINQEGFDFLEKIQGHWTGTNRVIADDYDWFSFDFRANSPSQIHSIFEGGSMGNLLTSFFVTDFKSKRTIMVRNGGVLSGIYRTSYFVLDKVEDNSDGKYYRFIDAKGGANTMFMELRFKQDSLYFNAYTSRLGSLAPASRHMTFKGIKSSTELASTAALEVEYPQNTPAWDFSEGFIEEYLYINPGETEAKSATFLAQSESNSDVFDLAFESGDPWRIDEHPYLALLQLDIEYNPQIEGKTLFVNLSKEPLTDEYGYFTSDEYAFESVLLFSELNVGESQFLYTYVHPGTYYVNITADINEDGYISEGDITHPQQSIIVVPEGEQQITISNITIEN